MEFVFLKKGLYCSSEAFCIHLQQIAAAYLQSIPQISFFSQTFLLLNAALPWRRIVLWFWTSSKLHLLLTPQVYSTFNIQTEAFDCFFFVFFIRLIITALTSNEVVFPVMPTICSDPASSNMCLRWMFVWLHEYKCGPTKLWNLMFLTLTFSIFTWHCRAGLDYLQQARSTAYSDQLSGVCLWLRAQRLLESLENKQKNTTGF